MPEASPLAPWARHSRGPSWKTPPTALQFANVGSASSSTDATSYTFAGQAIGAAAANRRVIVGALVRRSGTINITGVTIGGIAATLLGSIRANSNADAAECFIAVYGATVPSGTTADIVVTTDATALRCAIAFATVNGASLTPYATLTNAAASTPTGTINVASGGAVFAFSGIGNPCVCAWTGATEAVDAQVEANSAYSLATLDRASAESGRTITATWTSSTPLDAGLVAVSFQAG